MLTSSMGQTRLFNYINRLSQIPIQRFQLPAAEVSGIDRYLGVARREMAGLMLPLGLSLTDLDRHLTAKRPFPTFFRQSSIDWLEIRDGKPAQTVIDDLGELHLSLYDARHEFGEWKRLKNRYPQIAITQEPSEALKRQLRRLEGAWSSRIQLAAHAIKLARPRDEDVAPRFINRALGAYCDTGVRTEFTVLATPESIRLYFSN